MVRTNGERETEDVSRVPGVRKLGARGMEGTVICGTYYMVERMEQAEALWLGGDREATHGKPPVQVEADSSVAPKPGTHR